MSKTFTDNINHTDNIVPTPHENLSLISRPQGVEVNPYGSIEGNGDFNKSKGRRKKKANIQINSI